MLLPNPLELGKCAEIPYPSLGRGYLYAGLEFGAECYCGHKIQASNASESECNMECKGERSNTCGGINRLSIYRLELAQESARRCKLGSSLWIPAQPCHGGTSRAAGGVVLEFLSRSWLYGGSWRMVFESDSFAAVNIRNLLVGNAAGWGWVE